MGYNRSGKRRTERLKRARKEMERLLRKASEADAGKGKQPQPAAAAK